MKNFTFKFGMPRGAELSNVEQVKMKTVYEGGTKIWQIATATNRHRNIITKFLKNSKKYEICKRRHKTVL